MNQNENYCQESLLLLEEVAENYLGRIYKEIRPFLRGDILEIGSGVGTYIKKIVNGLPQNKIIVSDLEEECVKKLREQFRNNDNISCLKIDAGDPADFLKISKKVDSIFCISVLEHIEDDIGALNNMYEVLESNGRLVLLVPMHKFLYNNIDKSLGHFRRYSKREIFKKIAKTKFKVNQFHYFNFFSMFGWYINGTIFKKRKLNKKAMELFNFFTPLFDFIETYILRKKMGSSMIIVLDK